MSDAADPVDKEALDTLAELEAAEVSAALRLTHLKQEEVKATAVGRRIDDARQQLPYRSPHATEVVIGCELLFNRHGPDDVRRPKDVVRRGPAARPDAT